MTTGRMFGLTKQQKTARLNGEKSIILSAGQIAALRRDGLIARSHEWYSSPCGSFALAPGGPGAPWGEGRRERINVVSVTSLDSKAA